VTSIEYEDMNKFYRLISAAILALSSFGATASELDMHFYGVYAVGRAAGLSESDILLIARASQSLDENAETSPLPDSADMKARWWGARGTLWHSLPPLISSEYLLIDYKQMVHRRLVELYGRARNESDERIAKIYFGQYLHALVDSVTHEGYYDIIGHFPSHVPDVPGPEKRAVTTKITRLLVGEIASFQRDRLQQQPHPVPTETLNAVVNALTYAAPNGQEADAEKRWEVARQRLEKELKERHVIESIPKWGSAGVDAIPFDADGHIKKGNVIPPTEWERVLKSPASSATQAVLKTLGMPDADLGGIDFSSVHLHYVGDFAGPGNARQFLASFSPEVKGGSAPASMSLLALATALMLPDNAWWVNLNPDEPERITDPALGQTDVGRALLEADLLLKRVTLEVINPATDLGKKYWADVVSSPMPEAGSEWRVWIVPGDCTARVGGSEIELADCFLDVRANIERVLLDSTANWVTRNALMETRLRQARTYIIPALRQIINNDARFAELRAIYRGRALALAYKERFQRSGTLSGLVNSLKIETLPPSQRRDPKVIWADMLRQIMMPSKLIVPSPKKNGTFFTITGGGIVFDQVNLSPISEQQLMALRPPLSLGEGLLVSFSPAQQPLERNRFLELALGAYVQSNDVGIAAAAELMPALALLGDQAYNTIYPGIFSDPATRDWLAIAEALKNRPGDDAGNPYWAMSFAIWSRIQPQQVLAAIEAKRVDPLSTFIYLLATQASPRSGDPKPEKLKELLNNIIRPGSRRGELLADLTAAAAIVAPRATKQWLKQLLEPDLAQDLYKDAPSLMFACKSVVAVDVRETARIMSALGASFQRHGQQPPQEFAVLQRQVSRFELRHAAAQRAPDPFEQIQLARFEWLSNPATAIDRAESTIAQTINSLSARRKEDLILKAIPLIVWRNPAQALALANSLRNEPNRMIAFSWLAILSFDAIAADMILTQRIVLETREWMD
jgi:hypothetical protein